MAEQGALRGLRVVDMTDHRGEVAGRVLADLGAEVIAVEPPGGSASRRRAPLAPDGSGRSLWWETFALGKRSVVVDLEDASARTQLRRLILGADVLLESFAPGVMAGYGLDYASLAADAPGLVMASITAWGQDGPLAGVPATDLTLEAAGGLVGLQGDPDRPPLPIGFPQASQHAGVQAAADVLIALVSRELGGGGQYLDVSTQSAVVWTLMNATGWPSVAGGDPPGLCAQRTRPRPPPVPGMRGLGPLACADGHVVVGLHLPGIGERTLAGFVSWLVRRGALAADDAIARVEWLGWMNRARAGELDVALFNRAWDRLGEAFAGCTKTELLTLAVEHKLLLAPILTSTDLLLDQQLATRDFWRDVGGLRFAGPFARLSATPVELLRPAPAAGADQHLLGAPRATPAGPGRRTRALEGIKVADFAWVGVGPIISKALADHGAETIRVESSARQDILRQLPPFKDGEPGVNRSQFFANFNTSKRSIDLDLTAPDDLALALEIARWADVLVESFVPGTMARFGLDYRRLAELNPRLVMLSTCMRGQTGPQRRYGGFGNQGAALAGLFSVTGWPDRPPCGPWGAYTDFIAPRYGVAAIAAALLWRQQSGRGQYIDLSQIEAGIQFMGPLVPHVAAGGTQRCSPGMQSDWAAPHGVYACAGEERYVALAVDTDAQWRSLAALLGCDHWSGLDAQARHAAGEEIEAALAAWAREHPRDELITLCRRAGVPVAPVAWPSELYADAQLAHRNFFQQLDHAEMGRVHYDGHATLFSATPARLDRPGPCLGEHSAAIRARFGTRP